ncbi:Flp pilus assembly protein CpaB [Methylobacterium sp. WL69]|uniref:Flp pilus assembly protein CpaB n=1 Tax=Methylobacterium sp. WL69 TaxID=2603893 RepID=UPI0011C9338F|nr:Flp pilus assembly protein CpaB [Methylobacterium sp. WL69]TXM78838.1 Flp pilus assembly protein CpaB [Methylobacterium sp. WL69]
MRASSAISLGVALTFGALAAFLARGLLLNVDPQARRPVQGRMVVASAPVGFGTALTSANLREVDWPAGDVLDGAFTSIADLTRDGRRLALAPLQRNEPVLAAKVTAPNQRATLSTQIDEGMRAVSVRVDEVRGVAGFVLPGDRVDLILTRGEGGTQDNAYADVLIQNAKVLAIDQVAGDRQDKPTVARAVTLELSVAEAQKVVLAQGVGRLSLVLRQTGEPVAQAAQRVTTADLGPGESAAAKDRIAELTAQVEALRKASEAAAAQAGEGARAQLAEMETRLRVELGQRMPPGIAPSAPAPPKLTINVIRNGSKREPYSVDAED